jgi:hypothetical protein
VATVTGSGASRAAPGSGFDVLGADWRRIANQELAGERDGEMRLKVVGTRVDRIVLADRAVDALAFAMTSPQLPNTMYLNVPWLHGTDGRRIAVEAVEKVVARLDDRRVDPARQPRSWERDHGRAAGASVTVLTDAPSVGNRVAAHSLAVSLKMLGVRVHGMPAPRTTWEMELRRVLAASPAQRQDRVLAR